MEETIIAEKANLQTGERVGEEHMQIKEAESTEGAESKEEKPVEEMIVASQASQQTGERMLTEKDLPEPVHEIMVPRQATAHTGAPPEQTGSSIEEQMIAPQEVPLVMAVINNLPLVSGVRGVGDSGG